MSASTTTTKRSRCSNGTRKNKKNGKCEHILNHTCAICLDKITSGNVKTKCKHNFHKRCLIGWCKNKPNEPTCPICRADIKKTCVKITPFDSHEVFRYVNTDGDSVVDRLFKEQKLTSIILNKNFDVNVKNADGDSILEVLSHDRISKGSYLVNIDNLLQDPSIEVSSDLVRALIAAKNIQNAKILQLFKKHEKIPNALKGLV
jgi:hypothetical protein